MDRCENCNLCKRLEKWTYGAHGVCHEEQEGFACLAFIREGLVVQLVGTEGWGCEMFTPKGEINGR